MRVLPIVLAALLLLAGCGDKRAGQAPATVAPTVCADLVKGCRIGSGVTVRTDMPPQAMQPFKLLVDAPGARAMSAELNMLDMDMGPNRYRLLPDGKQFSAALTLPMCVSGRSDWILTLEVDGKPLKLQFATVGKRHGG